MKYFSCTGKGLGEGPAALPVFLYGASGNTRLADLRRALGYFRGSVAGSCLVAERAFGDYLQSSSFYLLSDSYCLFAKVLH